MSEIIRQYKTINERLGSLEADLLKLKSYFGLIKGSVVLSEQEARCLYHAMNSFLETRPSIGGSPEMGVDLMIRLMERIRSALS